HRSRRGTPRPGDQPDGAVRQPRARQEHALRVTGPSVARSRTGARIVTGVLVLLGGLLAAGLLWAPAASAHAASVSSSPVAGARVNTEPAQVRLTFDEPVGLVPAAVQVISNSGLRADTGQPRLADGGTTIVLPLRPHLPHGTYSAT